MKYIAKSSEIAHISSIFHVKGIKTCKETSLTNIMHGNRTVLLRYIDASCRTVNLLCFSSCRTQNFQIAVRPETRVFENNSVKSLSLQMKLIPKVILNMLNVLTLKKNRKML